MCRLLGYFGAPISIDHLLLQPDHSLAVQSYQPREMTSGLLNADGFGVGWYHPTQRVEPFTYKNTLPIWSDMNLPSLSRFIESPCFLANVRSATPGLPVELSNCQPFQHRLILGVHNGFIANFRETLYRPMRDRLSDLAYRSIQGSTDSEHLFAWVIDAWARLGCLTEAVKSTIQGITDLAAGQVEFSANLIVSDGQQIVATRFANRHPMPSLYCLHADSRVPNAVIIASEPLFTGNWTAFPERSILTVSHDFQIQFQSL